MKRFEGKVQLVLYPFAFSDRSAVAAQVAWCAGEQGKFWEVHHMLYQRQETWSRFEDPLDRLVGYSERLGVEADTLRSCVKSGRMKPLIQADKELGRSLQVRSTPTIFINNQRSVGVQPEADYVRMIRQELSRAQRNQQ